MSTILQLIRLHTIPGHYELNLTLPAHRHIANRLKDAAFEETEFPNWKNIIYDQYSEQMKVAANYGPPAAWKNVIPRNGSLSFDFVSGMSPPENVRPCSHEDVRSVLTGPVCGAVLSSLFGHQPAA